MRLLRAGRALDDEISMTRGPFTDTLSGHVLGATSATNAPIRRLTVTLGPLDYTVIGFAGNNFNGRIANEIGKVVDAGIVRIVDLVFVTKDSVGNVDIVELDNADNPKFESFAGLLADRMGLLTPEDIGQIADDLPLETSALIILWENKWAEKIKKAILDSDGFLVAHTRIQPEALAALNDELEAAGAIS